MLENQIHENWCKVYLPDALHPENVQILNGSHLEIPRDMFPAASDF